MEASARFAEQGWRPVEAHLVAENWEITGERVAILADMAIRAENIDEAKAEEARRRAEARLAEQIDDEETATVQAALAHSLAQIKVKRRQTGR